MSTEPEALRLADALEELDAQFNHTGLCGEAAAELRRLALKQWVGLTADEIWKCNKAKSGSAVEFHICYAHQNVLDFAESIEAKLKEKNA